MRGKWWSKMHLQSFAPVGKCLLFGFTLTCDIYLDALISCKLGITCEELLRISESCGNYRCSHLSVTVKKLHPPMNTVKLGIPPSSP